MGKCPDLCGVCVLGLAKLISTYPASLRSHPRVCVSATPSVCVSLSSVGSELLGYGRAFTAPPVLLTLSKPLSKESESEKSQKGIAQNNVVLCSEIVVLRMQRPENKSTQH